MIGLLVCEAGRGKLLDKQQNKSFTESYSAIYHVVAVWPALHAGLDAVSDSFVSLHRNRPPTTRHSSGNTYWHSSGNTYWSMRLLFLYFRNVQRSQQTEFVFMHLGNAFIQKWPREQYSLQSEAAPRSHAQKYEYSIGA